MNKITRANAGVLQELEVAQRQAHWHRGTPLRWDVVYNTPHPNAQIEPLSSRSLRIHMSVLLLSFAFVVPEVYPESTQVPRKRALQPSSPWRPLGQHADGRSVLSRDIILKSHHVVLKLFPHTLH